MGRHYIYAHLTQSSLIEDVSELFKADMLIPVDIGFLAKELLSMEMDWKMIKKTFCHNEYLCCLHLDHFPKLLIRQINTEPRQNKLDLRRRHHPIPILCRFAHISSYD